MSAVQSARPIFEDKRAAVRQAVPNNATFMNSSYGLLVNYNSDNVERCIEIFMFRAPFALSKPSITATAPTKYQQTPVGLEP
eukprot:4601307-Pleurochrysis_carterae.AAC.1